MSDAIPTAVPGFTIRFASAKDVPVLLRFIRDLAAYEKLLHEVTATEALLHASLFGGRRTAEAVIGELDGEPVAFALFFHNFSTFVAKPGIYLEDLYVSPARRGRGLGRAMLTFLARLALDRGCGRFEWACSTGTSPRSASTASSARFRRTSGRCFACKATRWQGSRPATPSNSTQRGRGLELPSPQAACHQAAAPVTMG